MFDSHCHLTDERFADDVPDVIARARAAGVTGLVTIASDVADTRAAIDLARRHAGVYATAGIHPHVAVSATDGDFTEIRALTERPEVVAIGETGLDFHYDNSPRQQQLASFERHVGIAAETGLPLVVHSRSADDDTAAIVSGAGVTGVLHCFAGGGRLLNAALDAGWYISFAGLVTFRNFDGADLLRAVPLQRLLLETDSPYLAPVPHRGRRNEPAFVVETCRTVARLRGVDAAELATAVAANARRFYGLTPES